MPKNSEKTSAKTGRPSKYSEELADKILKEVENGIPRTTAAQIYEVASSTLNGWLNARPSFAERMARAEAIAEKRNVLVLQRAGAGYPTERTKRVTKTVIRMKRTTKPDGTVVEEPVALQEVTEETIKAQEFDWRASLEWLARRRSAEWGRATKLELSGPDGGPIPTEVTPATLDLSKLSVEELEQLEAIQAKLAAPATVERSG